MSTSAHVLTASLAQNSTARMIIHISYKVPLVLLLLIWQAATNSIALLGSFWHSCDLQNASPCCSDSSMAPAPHYATVTWKCKFWGKVLPNLGLDGNLDMEFRVYMLKCAPAELCRPFTWYVGIEEKSSIGRRLRAAFEQKSTAALFCRPSRWRWFGQFPVVLLRHICLSQWQRSFHPMRWLRDVLEAGPRQMLI